MNLSETIVENRKTLRAAISVLPGIGIAQRALVLTVLDRHFELQAAIVARLEQLERGGNRGEYSQG